MRLSEDAKGLRHTITLNEKDPIAVSVAAKIARRDVTDSSFWFEPISHDDEQWKRGAAGQLPLRTLLKVKLIEASPVASADNRQRDVDGLRVLRERAASRLTVRRTAL